MLSVEMDLNLLSLSDGPGLTERVYFHHLYQTVVGYSPFLFSTLFGYLAAGKLTTLSWRTDSLLRGNDTDKPRQSPSRLKLNAMCTIFTLSLIVDTMRVTKEHFSNQVPPNTSCYHLAIIAGLGAELAVGVAVAYVTRVIWTISNIYYDFLSASGYLKQAEGARAQHASWRYILCLMSMVLFTNLGYLHGYSTPFMLFTSFCLVVDLSMLGAQVYSTFRVYATQQLVWKPIVFILAVITAVIFASSRSSDFWDQAALINSKLQTAETTFAINYVMNYILPAIFVSPCGWFIITCLRFDRARQQENSTNLPTSIQHTSEAWVAQSEKHNPYRFPLNQKLAPRVSMTQSLPRRNYYSFALVALTTMHLNLLCLLSIFEIEKVDVEMYAFWSAYAGEVVVFLTVLAVAHARGELSTLWKFT